MGFAISACVSVLVLTVCKREGHLNKKPQDPAEKGSSGRRAEERKDEGDSREASPGCRSNPGKGRGGPRWQGCL